MLTNLPFRIPSISVFLPSLHLSFSPSLILPFFLVFFFLSIIHPALRSVSSFNLLYLLFNAAGPVLRLLQPPLYRPVALDPFSLRPPHPSLVHSRTLSLVSSIPALKKNPVNSCFRGIL